MHKLLSLMQPQLLEGEYVFCTLEDGALSDVVALAPMATFLEKEGLSLLLGKTQAEAADLAFSSIFRCITLSVHSSLDAVGFTAAVASKLAANGIPANVVAAHYHDHVFVPADRADAALKLLTELEN